MGYYSYSAYYSYSSSSSPLIVPLHGGREERRRGREGGRGRGIGTLARPTRPADLTRTTAATTIAVGVRIAGPGRIRVREDVGDIGEAPAMGGSVFLKR